RLQEARSHNAGRQVYTCHELRRKTRGNSQKQQVRPAPFRAKGLPVGGVQGVDDFAVVVQLRRQLLLLEPLLLPQEVCLLLAYDRGRDVGNWRQEMDGTRWRQQWLSLTADETHIAQEQTRCQDCKPTNRVHRRCPPGRSGGYWKC